MTDLGLFRGRRLRPEELVDVVRKRAGVELLAGFERLVEARGAVSYQGEVPIASGSHLAEAHLIRQQPGAELTWETARVGHDLGGRDVVFVFPMAMGNGSPLPQPSGQFDLYLNGRRVLGLTLTKDSQRWQGSGCCLYFDVRLGRATAFGASLTLDERIRDEAVFADGMALLSVAPELLAPGEPARLRVVPVQRQPSRRWFRLGRPLHPFLTDHLEPGLSALLTRKRPPRVGEYQLLFGDLHAHSAESLLRDDQGCGEGSREDLFGFARDVAGLDVFCLSEHDWQLNDEDWKGLQETSDRFDEAGRAVPARPTCGGTSTSRASRPSRSPTTCRWRCSRCRWSTSTTPATTASPRCTRAGATRWSTTGPSRPTRSACRSWPSSTRSATDTGWASWPAPTPTTATPAWRRARPATPTCSTTSAAAGWRCWPKATTVPPSSTPSTPAAATR